MRASSANREPRTFSWEPGLAFALLFDARGFSAEIPEVVELRTTDPAMTFYLDSINRGGVEREHSLHTNTTRDLADSEHLARAATLAGEDDALEDLDALFVAFLDLHVDLDRVAGREVRDIAPRLARLYDFHDFWHDTNSCGFLRKLRILTEYPGLEPRLKPFHSRFYGESLWPRRRAGRSAAGRAAIAAFAAGPAPSATAGSSRDGPTSGPRVLSCPGAPPAVCNAGSPADRERTSLPRPSRYCPRRRGSSARPRPP